MTFMHPARATSERSVATPWLLCPRPRPQARLRLFAIPYAGRGPSLFRAWTEQLPDDVELCLIHLPGREQRFSEPACTRLETLLDHLIPALCPWLDRPWAVFGHSMGALIGFELARRLMHQQRQAPLHLFVSGYPAPHLARPASLLYTLPDAALKEALQGSGGTPKEILAHPELLDLLLPTLRADVTLCATYHYQAGEPLSCPLSVFGGWADRMVAPETLDAWQQQTTAACTVKLFPGDHFFLHREETALVDALGHDLAQDLPLPGA